MKWLADFMGYIERGDLLHIAASKAGTTVAAIKRECERNVYLQEFIDTTAALRADKVEQTMYERAVNGIEKGVYYKGEKVDTERQYSDALLVKLAEAYRPEKFTPRQNIQQISAIEVSIRSFDEPALHGEVTAIPLHNDTELPEDFV